MKIGVEYIGVPPHGSFVLLKGLKNLVCAMTQTQRLKYICVRRGWKGVVAKLSLVHAVAV